MAGPMLPVVHALKVWPEYFDALSSGIKSFEFRADDRTPRYEAGDFLSLREWCPRRQSYTGRTCFRCVTYVARGGVIPTGYACMALELATPFQLAAYEAMPTVYEGSHTTTPLGEQPSGVKP